MLRIVAALALAAAVPLAGPSAGAADGQYTVRLEAVPHAGGEPIQDRMTVKIWARTGTRTGGKVAELSELPAKIGLTPGEYRVLTVYGTIRRVQDIEVGLGGQTTLNLAAGRVDLALLDRARGQVVSGPVTWSVHQYKRGQQVGEHIADLTGDPASVRLTAGHYDVVAEHDGDRVAHVVQVVAGQTSDYTLIKE